MIICPDQVVLVCVSHQVHNGSHQQVLGIVKLLVGFSLNDTPDVVVQGIQIRTSYIVDNMTMKILSQPFLDSVGHIKKKNTLLIQGLIKMSSTLISIVALNLRPCGKQLSIMTLSSLLMREQKILQVFKLWGLHRATCHSSSLPG